MKIAVCIKQVPARDWQPRLNDTKTWIRDQDATFEMNEPDAYALEEALRLKEKHAGEDIRQLIAHSRYVDRFERRDGDWRIAHRVVVTDSARTDAVAPWQGTSPISSLTRGTRDHTDPVFRR